MVIFHGFLYVFPEGISLKTPARSQGGSQPGLGTLQAGHGGPSDALRRRQLNDRNAESNGERLEIYRGRDIYINIYIYIYVCIYIYMYILYIYRYVHIYIYIYPLVI